MNDILKKILGFKGWRFVFAGILFFIVFKKINFVELFNEIKNISVWLIIGILLANILIIGLTSFRWSLLILEKIKFKDIFVFWKANMKGYFYGLVFPSMVVGDCIKWLPIHKNYPKISKSKCLTSSLLDRIIGMTAFVTLGFLMLVLSKFLFGFYSQQLFFVFSLLFLGVIVFIVCIFVLDIKKILSRISFLKKFENVLDLIGHEKKGKLAYSFLISLFYQFLTVLITWAINSFLHVGLPLVSFFVFMPVIALLSILPISIAGFGGSQFLFVHFFSNFGVSSEKLFFLSTFMSIVGVLTMFSGGLLFLLDKEKIDRTCLKK